METSLTHITEIITAVASTLIAWAVFYMLRRFKAIMVTVSQVDKFMEEDRHEHRKNEADHDLLFDHLDIPRHKITTARQRAGVNGGNRVRR